jgi:hypothetical protein
MAVLLLPIFLKEEEKAVNMEEMKTGKDLAESLQGFVKLSEKNDIFKQRLVEVTQEMIDEGLLAKSNFYLPY